MNSILSIEPGVALKFNNGGISASGTFNSIGDEINKILFTSIYDDSDGNDTINDKQVFAVATPTSYLWRGLIMETNSISQIKNAEIKYATAGISYIDSPLVLKKVKFEKNNLGMSVDNVSIKNHSVNVECVEFVDNITDIIPTGFLTKAPKEDSSGFVYFLNYELSPEKIREMQEEYDVKVEATSTTTPVFNAEQIEEMNRQYIEQKQTTSTTSPVLLDEQIRKMQEEYEKSKNNCCGN